MSETNPTALSLEDSTPTLESVSTGQLPAEAPPDDDHAELEGVVEIQGKRLVDVSVVAAERKRARDATEKRIRETELEPLKLKAQEVDHLRAALADAQPYVDHLRKHPELLQTPKPTPLEEQISDEDAAQEARDLELYRSDGQPDTMRAKRIIARRRQEAQTAAEAATKAVIGPVVSRSAQEASKQNFVSMAMRRDGQGQSMVDPKVLAEYWAQLPPELTQHPEVGELVLDAAIGKSIRTTGRVPRAERPPPVSESPGGRSGPSWQMTEQAKAIAKSAGLSEKAFAEGAKEYKPGQINVIGD